MVTEFLEGRKLLEPEEPRGVAVQRLPFVRTRKDGTSESLARAHRSGVVEVAASRACARAISSVTVM